LSGYTGAIKRSPTGSLPTRWLRAEQTTGFIVASGQSIGIAAAGGFWGGFQYTIT